ncbi:MAG: redox-regulated ATPase YchF [Spirochaetes bacterium]|nr:redox-regulated ATPase YchF [Spirochaetota bacterium]
MKVGLVGLDESGKDSIFQLLTGHGESSHDHKNPEIAEVSVLDDGLDFIFKTFSPSKKHYVHIQFVILPSISKESMETRKALVSIKEVDIVTLVIRQFKNENVYHPLGNIDPQRDFSYLMDELIYADLYLLETRLERIKAQLKLKKDDFLLKEQELVVKIQKILESDKTLHQANLNEAEEKILKSFSLLTLKPIFVIVNCDEKDLKEDLTFPKGINSINISLETELQLNQLEPHEREEYLRILGINESGIRRLIKFSYDCGDLITFYTYNEKEARAWAIRKGTTALKAAGHIHTDFEKGFIRAEVIHYHDLEKAGSEAAARKNGLYHLEGKDYIVQDRDIIKFRFNV